MRLIVFGSSIVSDWRNPLATSARPILANLIAQGHDVLFLEERNNLWLVELLRARGMAPVRAFEAAYPTLQHRSYDIPRGYQRTVEFAQHVGSADAIVALPGTPVAILEEVALFRSRSVVRAVHVDLGDVEAELRLGSVGQPGIDAVLGPAVERTAVDCAIRSEIAVIAYDEALADTTLDAVRDLDPIFVNQASPQRAAGMNTPEVELPGVFARCHTVIVAGDWLDPLAWARLLLPRASGCRTIAVGPGAESAESTGVIAIRDVSQLADLVRKSPHEADSSPLPDRFAASIQARELIGVLRHAHDAKRLARR